MLFGCLLDLVVRVVRFVYCVCVFVGLFVRLCACLVVLVVCVFVLYACVFVCFFDWLLID